MTAEELIGPTAGHLIETEVEGDIGLYDPSTEEVVVLNETASDIWRLCDGDLSLDGIVARLATAYGIAEAEIRDEVGDTIDDFRRRGFIE